MRFEWTRETEEAALVELRAGKVLVLVYARQSRSDFDASGNAKGPSLEQQIDSCARRPEFARCRIETFQDADRSGKETSRRPGYLAMMERLRAGNVGAVCFYDQSRLHRNVVEFHQFMADCETRRVLVFSASGLIRNEDEYSWSILAAVNQAQRKEVARRVRDNLRYLRERGHWLGRVPAGYKRIHGRLVVDEETAPQVRRLFQLYATGAYSFKSLADELNAQGVKPPISSTRHRTAEIFSWVMLKDLLNNPSYLGKVPVRDGSRIVQLIAGEHPALVDQATFDRCREVRVFHRRRTQPYKHIRRAFALTPLLYCGACGGLMRGRTRPPDGRTYYVCANRLLGTCEARYVRADRLERGLREQLRRLVGGEELDEQLRVRLRRGTARIPNAEKAAKARLRSLNEQAERVAWMYQRGDLDQAAYVERIGRINLDRQNARAQSAGEKSDPRWIEKQVVDLIRIWELADAGQRLRLLSSIFDRIEAETAGAAIDVVATPRPSFRGFFAGVSQSGARPGRGICTSPVSAGGSRRGERQWSSPSRMSSPSASPRP